MHWIQLGQNCLVVASREHRKRNVGFHKIWEFLIS